MRRMASAQSPRRPAVLNGALALSAALLTAACSNTDLGSKAGAPLSTASITPISKSALPGIPGVDDATANTKPLAPAATDGKPLKIGLLLPLGGFDQTAAIAKGMKQAAEMALFEANRPNIQLIVKDDKGSPEGARAAADEAIKEGAEIILGPLFGRSVAGAAQVAKPANVAVLSFSNDQQVAGAGVYAIGFSPAQDVERVVSYAARQNKKRFAAILPDDAYGKVLESAFKASVARANGTIAMIETYPAGANAMLGPSRRFAEAAKSAAGSNQPIDAVFIPGGPDILPQLGPLLTYAGFDATKIKVLGTGAWEFATIGNTEAFVGGWYPGTDPQGWRSFSGRFVSAFGQPPPRMASVAFDAMSLAISLSSEPVGQRFTAANLMRPAGFSGVEGSIRLTSAGTAERALAVIEVQKLGTTVLEQPTNGFGVPALPKTSALSPNNY
jgi:branched-chain amino acid transport system substrate-binding protein